MPVARGYVLKVTSSRVRTFTSSLESEEYFAEAVPEFDYPRTRRLICFISADDDVITHLGVARRGVRAGTGLRRLNVHDIATLHRSISYPSIVEHCTARVRSTVDRTLRRGGLLSPTAFSAVVDAIRHLAPETRSQLDRFSAERQEILSRLSPDVRHTLALQKESVATALAFADIDREPVQSWDPTETAPTSFLDGLPQAVTREDAVIVNDLTHVPGFDLIRTKPYGAAIFANERARLSVVLANHQPLEQRLGADLIYFNETYRSFVIVQYKMMENRGRGPFFALPNEQLTREVERMEATLATLNNAVATPSPIGYRLLHNPFFLKFCPRVIFEPDNAALSHGMYLPLDLWRILETDESLRGERGGRRLTYQNVGRYFENTSFIALIANGWIGTGLADSQILQQVIRDVLASGRPLTVAVKTDTRTAPAFEETDIESDDELFE